MSDILVSRPGAARVAELRLAYGHLPALDLLQAMVRREFPGRIAVTSSFGAESAVLLDLVAQVDPHTPVIFLDTDALFDETVSYYQDLQRRLGLTDVRCVRPSDTELRAADNLWHSDVETCCHLRKVLPMQRATAGFHALIDGRKGFHGAERASIEAIEPGAGGVAKISPLVRWTAADIDNAFAERNLPRHPLVAKGYRSIGCWPCTRPVAEGEPVRAGRWPGAAKTECGIHTLKWAINE